MDKNWIDQAIGKTPDDYNKKLEEALLTLKEDKKVKKVSTRAMVLAFALILAVCGIAYAASTQGLEWFMSERTYGFKENDPDLFNELVSNMQTEPVQENTNDLVNVTVQDAVWLENRQTFKMTVMASVRDKTTYEMHPEQNMDADGAYSPEDVGIDEEARAEHWLWTTNGFGKPEDVMADKNKKPLLYGGEKISIGTPDGCELSWSSYDTLVNADGNILSLLEVDLARFTDEYWDAARENVLKNNETAGPDDYKYSEEKLQQVLAQCEELKAEARTTREAIEKYTDTDGFLTLCYLNSAETFPDAEIQSAGYVTFKIKIK